MTGVTYVLIIAVEDYFESSDFPKVAYAKKDAEDLIDAFKKLGYEDEDFVVLINEKATRTAIIQKVKKISERALENDRIIFYFAGHGFYENGENLLGSVDAIKTAKPDTCVPINTILGYLKRSLSKHKILFLDCCHSGFEAGEYIRDGLDSFEADELVYQFRQEEYFIGFGSCKTNQTSFSHPNLKNGVWSHFLIKALSGDAEGVYKKGLLFSDKLQAYLNKETAEYVKLNTVAKKDQTPIKFGSETDKFIIADLNPIFEENKRNRKISDITFTNISLLSEESDSVKSLPGFQKSYHKVPTYVGATPNGFIQELANKIIEDEISYLSESLKKELGYKRVEIRPSTDKGSGSIETPDFDYTITITQSESNPSEYVVIRSLENFKNSDIVKNSGFNKVFSRHFNKLTFDLSKSIKIENLIDKVEALEENSPITVDYNPSNLNSCKIFIEGLDYEIFVESNSISITTTYETSPEKLINAFRETHKAILQNPKLKMLE
ncbi:caspase domain-containing protein [Flavobacterium sp. PS2]|uniref:caspase family protein n=1 Tax=Flavobacterium sp. PS2 TaxID=3384157 RepID=UPI00390CD6DF